MSYVLCPMSCVLCPMSYVLCHMSYVLCPMSYGLCPMSYVICPMPYVIRPMSYVLWHGIDGAWANWGQASQCMDHGMFHIVSRMLCARCLHARSIVCTFCTHMLRILCLLFCICGRPTHIYMHAGICICICICICMHACMCMHACLPACMHACMQTATKESEPHGHVSSDSTKQNYTMAGRVARALSEPWAP